MDNITNVTINFELFETTITNLLKKFNKAKEQFYNREIDENEVLKRADEVQEQIVLYTELLGARIETIKDYMDDKFHNKQALRKERKLLNKKISKYCGLFNSIDEECMEIENGEADLIEDEFDDQLDY